jgi:hypothetical protein
MRLPVFILAALMGFTFPSFAADPLDVAERSRSDDMVTRARDLPATVVVRVNRNTNAIEVLHSRDHLAATPETISSISSSRFAPIELNKPVRGELDRDTSRSSWFFSLGLNPFFSVNLGYGPGAYYAPYYSYYNYSYAYNPYYYYYTPYSYGYVPYNYYFYRWY